MQNHLIDDVASILEKNAILLSRENDSLSLKDIANVAKEVDDCLSKILVIMNKLEVIELRK